MVAFVSATPVPVSSVASQFVTGNAPVKNDQPLPNVPTNRRASTTMKVLDGLDTVNQDSYGFSRYILGPFQPSVLSPNSDDGEREQLIKACYRQLFGNAYLMEEERAELAVAESQFKLGAIPAKEFVRAVAKSSTYKVRFFEGASQYRFIELNYMHLLGRAPDTREETSEHLRRYLDHGVDADIDSYIDSEEYDSVFGQDNIPFLRFRGAYTPCDSFNKQCALKGGWANSDKAMGGAALSGYNGSDGRQTCNRISAYITDATTPYEEVAANTPLKTTAPHWYACPDPALAPTPGYVSVSEVRALEGVVANLKSAYDAELEKKRSSNKDGLDTFRSMVADMGVTLDRGVAYSGGDPLLANPFAKLAKDSSALTDAGCKSSDYKRFHQALECDTLSRLERDLEEAKASLRVLSAALAATNPVNPPLELPGQVPPSFTIAQEKKDVGSVRPRVSVSRAKPVPVAVPDQKGVKIGPIQLPNISLPF